MKIRVEFDSLEEFLRHMKATEEVREAPSEEEAPAPTAEKPVDTGTGAIVGATLEEQKQIEAEEKVYALADAQKAVREVVKKKGKDAAKEVLSRFMHKDRENEPATGASALRPEDYAEAIRQLEEVLNG